MDKELNRELKIFNEIKQIDKNMSQDIRNETIQEIIEKHEND